LSRRPRRSVSLPSAASGLQAAKAGRFVVADGTLKLDKLGMRLLGLPKASLSVDAWAASLPTAQAQAWRQAISACGDGASPLNITTLVAGTSILWLGHGHAGRLEGLLIPMPVQAAPPAMTQTPSGGIKARDEFVAAISHELRTPLNAILGFGRLARADLPAGADRRHLDHIELSSRLMLRVVNDLLDLTRLEAGKLEIEPDQPLRIHAVVSRVLAVAASLRQDKPIKLYGVVDPQCPLNLRGDVGRIEQILLNLAANALKFTDRGRIVIDVRKRGQSSDSVSLRVSVSDTGVGIPMEQIERIGRPFEQASDLSMPRIEGTGLGLAVVNRLLELHGTQLRVASVSGGGSIFWFDIEWPLDKSTPDKPLVADTTVFSLDGRFTQTVATQWLSHGHALLPADQCEKALRWIVDMSHPEASALAQRARDQGREVFMVSADPVDDTSDAEILPMLPQRVFQSTEDGALEVDPQMQGLKVLVVEDNALNQHVLREFLRRLGADVVIVGEGRPVADLVSKRHFDVMLLDIQMPGMNGWQVAQAVRALPHGPQLPIIFLSAHIDASDQITAASLGAHACLTKPFDAPQLQGILRELAIRAGVSHRTFVPPVAATTSNSSMRPALMTMFASQWVDQRLAIMAARDNAVDLRQAVHALRGSLAVLGQADLLAQARSAEQALLAGQVLAPGLIDTLVSQIDQLLHG
jgi:two-component system sensor histidine kinase/response regulator